MCSFVFIFCVSVCSSVYLVCCCTKRTNCIIIIIIKVGVSRFPVPAHTSHIQTYKSLSSVVESVYILAVYERVVQVSWVLCCYAVGSGSLSANKTSPFVSSTHSKTHCLWLLLLFSALMLLPCLQCFDAVGWAAGRASGL